MAFERKEWDSSLDENDLVDATLEEAYSAGFWECHRQMMNEMARFHAEMRRRRWPNMRRGVEMLIEHLLNGKVS